MKVLIVDDNPHEARLLRQAMETVATVEFTQIAEGSEAIALLSSMEPTRFDLILLDWKLLGIRGDQLAKVFLSRPDRDPRIPLVFTSSAIPPNIQFELQELGCTVLTKPMDLEGYDEMAIRLTAICAEARRFSLDNGGAGCMAALNRVAGILNQMTEQRESRHEESGAAESGEPHCIGLGEVPPDAVRVQLDRILSSDLLKRSPQLSRFLTYVVTDLLESQGSGLKEYEIARKVLNKPSDFDVRLDPIVRVEARRLRARLNDYYAGEGSKDPVLIDLGKRGYRPTFTLRTEKVAESAISAIQPVSEGTAIAVLPFADMTEDGNHGYFCDGLTEELIHALTRVPGLHVASRSSAFQFKGAGQDIRKVGAELGVVAVMEGSLRRDGKRLRVTAQLTNASTGFHLWSETYDTELEDLFEVQEKISNAIVDTVRQQRQLPVTLLLQRRQSEHPEAYRRFLQGLQLLRSPLRSDLLRSESLLAGAVEADPDYAAAYAALARARVKLIWNEFRAPQDGWLLVKSAAERTLELDPASGLAHAALGSAHAAHDWNWPEAEKRFDLALKSGGCEAAVQQAWAVQYLSPLKKLDEALSAAALAAESAPDSLEAWHDLACIRFYRHEYVEASSQFRTLLADKPDYVDALLGLARCHLEMKEFQKALATAQLAVAVEDNPKTAAVAVMCLAAAGQGQEARRLTRNLEEKQRSQYVSPVVFALAAVSLQQYDEAVKHLEEALRDRSVRLIEIDLDPAYDPLRSRGLLEPFRASVCLPTGTN